ncbi:dATP/dGTP pyrophosphohydrolase domain-containing protein [Sinorhizobium meliloti]|uniref:dATP/dGTP pyrophosphohydrolase domain-containing protein n=1 Tax=Rhizobium meliloti TaxID=382 RepID=UPI0001E4AB5E|nr:dATP/dGTP pyrophosphohydrolase domain-containing protein [Sinorhizobium meliloti]AEG53147.1 protein of unknown function DUF550 [Sinorhizobium meliloti AK83]MDE4591138.1 DUF550 domain-containing protein [Sinorhizobium meliloti]SEI56077.1 Protein of unknown function [Sinorhizobium meliloti]
MGYQTYHEALDEAQAEAEAVPAETTLPMVDAIDAEVRRLLSADAINGRDARKSMIDYIADTAAFIARGAALRAYQEGLNQGRAQQPEPENPLIAYLRRQWEWSLRTFGPGFRTEGICDHIGKELKEVRKNPHDLMEWLDIVILALDGYWRHGGSPERAMTILQGKQDKNFARNWPDWRTMSEDKAIEHDRSGE